MVQKGTLFLEQGWTRRALQELQVSPCHVIIDFFANPFNSQEPLFCTRKNSAVFYTWTKLLSRPQEILWANPPFSQMDKVLTKLVLEPCRMVLVTPIWPNCLWEMILEKVSLRHFDIPSNIPLYFGDWSKDPLPPPSWATRVSYIDTFACKVDFEELSPKLVGFVQKVSRDWDKNDLLHQMSFYPQFSSFKPSMCMEREVQTHIVVDAPNESTIKGDASSVCFSCASCCIPCDCSKLLPISISPSQSFPSSITQIDHSSIEDFFLDFWEEVDVSFPQKDHLPQDCQFLYIGDDSQSTTQKANPHSSFVLGPKDKSDMVQMLNHKILQIEKQIAPTKQNLF